MVRLFDRFFSNKHKWEIILGLKIHTYTRTDCVKIIRGNRGHRHKQVRAKLRCRRKASSKVLEPWKSVGQTIMT